MIALRALNPIPVFRNPDEFASKHKAPNPVDSAAVFKRRQLKPNAHELFVVNAAPRADTPYPQF